MSKKTLITGIVMIVFAVLAIGSRWFVKAREGKVPIDSEVVRDDDAVIFSPTPITKDNEYLTKEVQSEDTDTKEQSNLKVGMDDEAYGEEQDAIDIIIEHTRPEFIGITEEIGSEFLRNDQEQFWRYLGLHVFANFGTHQEVKIEFLRLIESDAVASCVMELTLADGSLQYILGSYDKEHDYYEFRQVADIYSYDDSVDSEEGGL
jgi:hypothetical protein